MNRYINIDTDTSETGKLFRRNPIYPSVPPTAEDLYILSSVGDRYDTLALRFYGDPKLWWIIASSNNFNKTSLVLEPGIQIRIPASKQQAIELFNSVNSSR
jgi:hypothetical protein